VLTNLPVHVTFITSDVGSNYEMRWYGMVPVNRWTGSYIAPVSTTSARPATVLLYNRHATALSVDVTTTGGTTNVNVPAGGLFRYTMPMNSGALFESTDGRDFFAIANSDDEDQIAEWGHSLLPAANLAPAVKVGWAPGQVAPGPPPALNASPIWVTAASATTLNVDWDDDGTVDATVPITTPFESVRLFDTSDGDQTGARIFTTDGTLIAAAWGQDASLAFSNSPALDLGTLVLPLPDVTILKNSSLATDLNGNGLLDPGDTLLYTLFVLNTGVVDADDVIVTDTPDPYTTYALGTTIIDAAPYPDDSSPSTPFPLDESGINLGTLTPGLGNPLPSPQQQLINVAEVTYGTGVVVTSTNVGAVTPPQFTVQKSSDLSSPALPGQAVQYTIAIRPAACRHRVRGREHVRARAGADERERPLQRGGVYQQRRDDELDWTLGGDGRQRRGDRREYRGFHRRGGASASNPERDPNGHSGRKPFDVHGADADFPRPPKRPRRLWRIRGPPDLDQWRAFRRDLPLRGSRDRRDLHALHFRSHSLHLGEYPDPFRDPRRDGGGRSSVHRRHRDREPQGAHHTRSVRRCVLRQQRRNPELVDSLDRDRRRQHIQRGRRGRGHRQRRFETRGQGRRQLRYPAGQSGRLHLAYAQLPAPQVQPRRRRRVRGGRSLGQQWSVRRDCSIRRSHER
jgi:uncharacterized repeat protein (TIGR01451 family)